MLRSLRARLLVAMVVPAAVLFALAGAAGYSVSRSILEDQLGGSLSAIAASAAGQLDAARVLSIEAGDDASQTRTYRSAFKVIHDVQVSTGARRLCVFDAEGRVRLDTSGAIPTGSLLPELLRDRRELSQALAGHRVASEVLFQGDDGLYYKTGYAPLWNGGQVAAVVSAEGSAAFFRPLLRLYRGYALCVLGALAALALAAQVTARALTRPLSRLVRTAVRIGRGDLATAVEAEPTSEIGTLAHELESMRVALESRDQQLKMMLAGVAHEVRNPMGGMELFAGLLSEELSASVTRNEPVAAESVGHVQRIRGELDHLKRVVEQFLAFAREQPLLREPLDGAHLLRTAAELVVADAKAKRVLVNVNAEATSIEGDEALLLSAITNLLRNAVQASPPESEVQLRGVAEDGAYLVEVSDRGPGVPEENRARIFQPFFTTKEKGTGLGLALAQKIAHAHGGTLALVPRAGGAQFRLRVPSA